MATVTRTCIARVNARARACHPRTTTIITRMRTRTLTRTATPTRIRRLRAPKGHEFSHFGVEPALTAHAPAERARAAAPLAAGESRAAHRRVRVLAGAR